MPAFHSNTSFSFQYQLFIPDASFSFQYQLFIPIGPAFHSNTSFSFQYQLFIPIPVFIPIPAFHSKCQFFIPIPTFHSNARFSFQYRLFIPMPGFHSNIGQLCIPIKAHFLLLQSKVVFWHSHVTKGASRRRLFCI